MNAKHHVSFVTFQLSNNFIAIGGNFRPHFVFAIALVFRLLFRYYCVLFARTQNKRRGEI